MYEFIRKKQGIPIRHHICFPKHTHIRQTDMKKTGHGSLNMRVIFRCMMEDGYYPTFEKTHILFNIDDNVAVVEYEEGILSIRIFFSIDEDDYDLFLEASNATMLKTFLVKPVVMDNMKNIMFSCEMMCSTIKEFKKTFPRGIGYLKEAIVMHKSEMKQLILAHQISTATISANDDSYSFTKSPKLLS